MSAVLSPSEKKHQGLIAQMRATFGPQICSAFEDPDVVEIMLNDNGKLLIEKHGSGIVQIGTVAEQAARNIIALVASWMGELGNSDNPIVEGALPPEFGGARFEGVLPPCAPAPIFAIRLRARSIYSLEDYTKAGIMKPEQRAVIEQAIDNRKNILVSGGTGSGKTTLGNALLLHISQVSTLEDRVVIIEDTPELQCRAPNVVSLLTKDGVDIDMTRLLKATLRLRPNRIVLGEVRDKAALALLKAWNTGHPGGLATVHANNPQAALLRLDQLCQEAGVPSQRELINEAVDLVVQISRSSAAPGRRIEAIYDVKADRIV
jgi:type IV secretion system protein VirB11